MAEVRVVAFKVPLAGFVLHRADTDTTIRVTRFRETVSERELEIGQVLVFCIHKIATPAVVPVAVNDSVFDSPRLLHFLLAHLPAVQRLAVKDTNKALVVSCGQAGGEQRQQRDTE